VALANRWLIHIEMRIRDDRDLTGASHRSLPRDHRTFSMLDPSLEKVCSPPSQDDWRIGRLSVQLAPPACQSDRPNRAGLDPQHPDSGRVQRSTATSEAGICPRARLPGLCRRRRRRRRTREA